MRLKKKGGELISINITEVSVVDAPANQRKFLLMKSELGKAKADIRMETDGTLEGTTITVNGEEVEDLQSFYFSYYRPAEDEEMYIDPVSCSYTVTSDAEDGFHTLTYDLAKAEGKRMDLKKLAEFLKEVTGEDFTEEQLKARPQADLDSLIVMSQYGVSAYPDLAKAVGHFVKDSVEAPADQDPPTDADKTEIDAETLESLKNIVSSINLLITGKKPEDADGTADIVEKLKGITKRIGKLEKGKAPDDPPDKTDDDEPASKEILDLLKGIEDRLVVVEKDPGVRKGIDEDPNSSEGVAEDKYKSIPL